MPVKGRKEKLQAGVEDQGLQWKSSDAVLIKDEENSVNLKVEDDGHGEEHSSPVPATFEGRLDLSSFAFKSAKIEPTTIRRSPRNPHTRGNTPQSVATGLTKRQSRDTLTSPSPSKKSRSQSGYAPPSKYAHLPTLPDRLAPNLIVLFVGLNPGVQTALSGHAYAHPSNLFWKLLHSSGCTTRRCRPEEDVNLPTLFALGNTNIVERATRNGSELSKAEMDASVHILEEKIRKWKPECVAIVGKSIWESLWRVRHGRAIRKEDFRYGWQDDGENMGEGDGWKGAKVFVASSTSGLAASLLPAEKERIWRELGVWVEQRRKDRGDIVDGIPQETTKLATKDAADEVKAEAEP
jgi:mismatch-specific thymine-DNA glycosylase